MWRCALRKTQDLSVRDRQSQFNESYDPKPYAAKKLAALQKRAPIGVYQTCREDLMSYKSVGIVHNINWRSLGALHLVTQQLCAPVTGSFATSVTHTSSLGWSLGSKDLPAAQKLAVRTSAAPIAAASRSFKRLTVFSHPGEFLGQIRQARSGIRERAGHQCLVVGVRQVSQSRFDYPLLRLIDQLVSVLRTLIHTRGPASRIIPPVTLLSGHM